MGHRHGFYAVGLSVAWLAIGLGNAGCDLHKPVYTSGHLSPMSRPFEGDVPVPIGFRFVESGSEDASTGARRLYLRHLYVGEAHKLNVRNFYREQMPLARWVKISDNHVKGEYSLRFEKNQETCTVMIRDRAGKRGLTEVWVTIIPKETGLSRP